ncbi:MAG: peptide chain release factor N(5)-glutamine methyltransferase [Johnsonella sp.]|nr:peptide chain release factor N(5)-glutamine methyltransferase [Johnsonella sp.]
MMYRYREVLEEGRRRLREAGIAEAEYDARELLFFALDTDMQSFYLRQNEPIDEDCRRKYFFYLQKRAEHIPLQHIMGKQNFCGLDIFVNEDVLIPRFDTELLVEKILKEHPDGEGKALLDLCTGSGAIAISLKKLGGFSRVYASDISGKALQLAKKSASYQGSEIIWIESDLFAAKEMPKDLDIIVSNPPYIRSEKIEDLMPEVRLHEPRLALDGGREGLDFYWNIAERAPFFLKKDALLYLEIGHDQGKEMEEILRRLSYREIEITKDLAGKDRICRAKAPA